MRNYQLILQIVFDVGTFLYLDDKYHLIIHLIAKKKQHFQMKYFFLQ
ncbi:MAG: hypothetical protein KAT04_03860 [Methylococcales bacterium]|nr:hypothetical protein [Methylococcales bacterium]